ncbi:MAG: hypothetical protein JST86_06155 [Bacteroidetes bacterium]|nr:hypothetical protein [Bacteroidota bacterium]
MSFQTTQNIQKTAMLFLFGLFASCSSGRHSQQAVIKAMHHYDQSLILQDEAKIAACFTPDGDLGTVAHGRDSIQQFLTRFRNIKVIAQQSVVEKVTLYKDSVLMTGTYKQSDIILPKDSITVSGSFTATWFWIKGKGWHIKKMFTTPDH